MADLRTQWQDFKKKYPQFAKLADAKYDLGPMLDARAKNRPALAAAVTRVRAAYKSLQTSCSSISDAAVWLQKNTVGGQALLEVDTEALAKKTVTYTKNVYSNAGDSQIADFSAWLGTTA